VAAPSMVQPLLSLKENTTPHPANKKQFPKADTSGTTIFFWENFLPVTNFYTLDLQRVKNIFGKLYAREEVVKENIW
jgi:hypothetical protein